ncbi:MAG: hypothetical protein ABSD64_06650 [Terriglobales bacterium]|jgi:hypothetical protein
MKLPDKNGVLDAIRYCAEALGHTPSRSEFKAESGMSEYQVLQHFPSWREAVRAAGLVFDPSNVKLDDSELLKDWGSVVRSLRQIPTRLQYKNEGSYSPGSFEKHFGPWSLIPSKFQEFAKDKAEWVDVLTLLPVNSVAMHAPAVRSRAYADGGEVPAASPRLQHRHSKLQDRTTYGNPVNFRGLRHEPVNEQGVVFLFGMVARELGYLVEAVQQGFPDCEAKRQVDAGKWQRVRIEFEFESRNFRDHGHPLDGCDVIVCWVHNWADCPPQLEVLELKSVIKALGKSD